MTTSLRDLGFVLALGAALFVSACGGKSSSADDPASDSAPGARAPGASAATPAMTPAEFCAGSPLYDVAEQRIFDRLTPATPSDYLALRRLEVSVPTARDGDIGLVTMAERGTLCGGASDGAACKKSYGRLESDAPWSPLVFFTRGDKVGIVRSHGGAMTLLGTIDSPEEAFYVAQLGGFRFTCTGDNAAGYRAVDGGFEIVTQAGGCGKPIERIVVRVYADGSLEEISRVTTEAETRACPQP